MKNIFLLVFFIFGMFVLLCGAGSSRAYIDPSDLKCIRFTKACRSIDATHLSCDKVIIEHEPKVTYSSVGPERRTLVLRVEK